MKKKIVGIFVCTLLIATILPITETVIAGSEDDPEVEDRIFDVKLFGLFPFMPQSNFKYVDIISAWINEVSDNPDYLYMNLKIRDLEETTEKFDAIYVISWTLNSVAYSASVHIFPEGPTALLAGSIDEERNDYVDYIICDGDIDSINDIITWIIPKDSIGYPSNANKLENIVPHTHLRYPESSGIPMWDLFKDLPWNAKIIKDYIVQF